MAAAVCSIRLSETGNELIHTNENEAIVRTQNLPQHKKLKRSEAIIQQESIEEEAVPLTLKTTALADGRLDRLNVLGRSSSFSYFQRGRVASPVSCLKGSSNNSSQNSIKSENKPPKRVSWVDEVDVITFIDQNNPLNKSNCDNLSGQRMKQKSWQQHISSLRKSASFELGYASHTQTNYDVNNNYKEQQTINYYKMKLMKEQRTSTNSLTLVTRQNASRTDRGWALVRTKFRQIITALKDDIDF